MQKVTPFLRLRDRVNPLGLLLVGLLAAAMITSFAGIWYHDKDVSNRLPAGSTIQEKVKNNSSTHDITNKKIDPSNDKASQNTTTAAYTPQLKRTSSTKPISNPATVTASSASQMVNVSLSVNDSLKGTVSLSSSSNQCEVLSQARSTGLISSLDMRYNAQYKTYAIYEIDGIGDSGAVWWTYKVNGKTPPYGCSGMTAHNGDVVNWKYVKQ